MDVKGQVVVREGERSRELSLRGSESKSASGS